VRLSNLRYKHCSGETGVGYSSGAFNRRREVSQSQCSPLSLFSNLSSCLLLRFTVSLPTDERFPPGVAGGSPANSACQRPEVPSQNTGVGSIFGGYSLFVPSLFLARACSEFAIPAKENPFPPAKCDYFFVKPQPPFSMLGVCMNLYLHLD